MYYGKSSIRKKKTGLTLSENQSMAQSLQCSLTSKEMKIENTFVSWFAEIWLQLHQFNISNFFSSGSHVTFIYYKNAQNVTQCYSTDSKKVSNWAVFTLKPAYWKRSMLIYVYIPFKFVGYFVLCFKINIHANILCMLRQLKTIFKIVTKSRKYYIC